MVDAPITWTCIPLSTLQRKRSDGTSEVPLPKDSSHRPHRWNVVGVSGGLASTHAPREAFQRTLTWGDLMSELPIS